MIDPVQVTNDATLAAESWKKTAARWRKKCLALDKELEGVREALDLSESLARELKTSLDKEKRSRLTKAEGEQLVAERDAAKKMSRDAELHARRALEAEEARNAAVSRELSSVAKAKADADRSRKEALDAMNALRVSAVRLGIDSKVANDGPSALAQEIDKKILGMQQKIERLAVAARE